MKSPNDARRSLLFGIGGVAMSQVLPKGFSEESKSSTGPDVLGPEEGEHLIHFRDGGDIFIKVSATVGSENSAMGTQRITIGAGVPIHRHFQMEESFYVLKGGGFFLFDNDRRAIQQGSTVFIPKNHWHGFANPDHELVLLWIVAPAGLDGFFRETCSPPGTPRKNFTRDQIHQIALKYGTEFR